MGTNASFSLVPLLCFCALTISINFASFSLSSFFHFSRCSSSFFFLVVVFVVSARSRFNFCTTVFPLSVVFEMMSSASSNVTNPVSSNRCTTCSSTTSSAEFMMASIVVVGVGVGVVFVVFVFVVMVVVVVILSHKR